MAVAERLRVLFDVTRRARRGAVATGIDRVDVAYLTALANAPDIELLLVRFGPFGPGLATGAADDTARPASPDSFVRLREWLEAPGGATAPEFRAPAWRLPQAGRWLRGAFEHPPEVLRLKAELARAGDALCVYLNTSHGSLYRPAVSRWLACTRMRSVFFVHDLIPLEHPEFNRKREPEKHRRRLATIARHASRVLVNSTVTRAALLRHWQGRGQTPPVNVLPLGVPARSNGGAFFAAMRPPVPYFVVLSTLEPRKNHQMLLMIWQRLTGQLGNAAPRLVLVGRRGWENHAVFGLLDRLRGSSRHVVECPDLDDASLTTVLRGARALLSPSFAEGFGLPVAEALALGVPVIASDIPAHREVAAGCAELLDPLDGRAWQQAIGEFSPPGSSRQESARARAAAYRAPTWAAHFAQALPLLREAALDESPHRLATAAPHG